MLSLIKRKNEATQAAADLELVFRQGCEQKIKDFKILPNNFYDNTFIVGFIAGVLEALIDLQCLKGNALWAMNSQKWPDKLKLNFQINFIQNLDGVRYKPLPQKFTGRSHCRQAGADGRFSGC